jgi:hypothetical protein
MIKEKKCDNCPYLLVSRCNEVLKRVDKLFIFCLFGFAVEIHELFDELVDIAINAKGREGSVKQSWCNNELIGKFLFEFMKHQYFDLVELKELKSVQKLHV